MNRDLFYLHHILECIQIINKATKSKTKKDFENLGIIKDGILLNLQIMAESTKRLSKSLKLTASDIPWYNIGDFRNKLVHEYLGIDLGIVWKIIKKELPKLEKRVKKMIEFIEKQENN